MGSALARQKHDLEVHMLLRAQEQCQHINERHEKSRYLPGVELPENLSASTDVESVLRGAQYVIHAVPVQASRAFLESVKDILPKTTPVICVSKGIEKSTGYLMSELFPSALGRKQPCVFLSGPSFAQEVMLSTFFHLFRSLFGAAEQVCTLTMLYAFLHHTSRCSNENQCRCPYEALV
jgi:glycerol-3-phosphate dehydrogenase (NAD+)